MLNVLVNSYTCCPGMGSEQGMGWNWIINLADYCNLYIITEGEYRNEIEQWLSHPSNVIRASHMHFYWNPIGKDEAECERIRMICWNQGQWSFYYYYEKWQRSTADIALNICSHVDIHILHQLNMIGFREPGYLWKISKELQIPFIWGPIDAKETFPVSYLDSAPLKMKFFIQIKNLITKIQLRYARRVKRAAEQATFIVAASSNSCRSIRKYFHKEAILLNETGCHIIDCLPSVKLPKNTLDVLWVGKMDFRKQLNLALQALALLNHADVCLHIVGGGESSVYKDLAESLGVMEQCKWYGTISHEAVMGLMRRCDLLLFTSLAEGTPHVVLEAISNNLPVICFDTCGQGDCIDGDVGIKIELTNPKDSVNSIASALNEIYVNRNKLCEFSKNCSQKKMELSWESKVKKMINLYNECL